MDKNQNTKTKWKDTFIVSLFDMLFLYLRQWLKKQKEKLYFKIPG